MELLSVPPSQTGARKILLGYDVSRAVRYTRGRYHPLGTIAYLVLLILRQPSHLSTCLQESECAVSCCLWVLRGAMWCYVATTNARTPMVDEVSHIRITYQQRQNGRLRDVIDSQPNESARRLWISCTSLDSILRNMRVECDTPTQSYRSDNANTTYTKTCLENRGRQSIYMYLPAPSIPTIHQLLPSEAKSASWLLVAFEVGTPFPCAPC
ncbi:hypothetical protein F5Y18DRAFT_342700 [Xylariaceae sp. FL1019]|nr:hypothetical protein F5Y18DRAFT_342700 [Xylariaceae sp. FL1019]